MKTLLLGDVSPTKSTNHFFDKMDIQTLFTDTVSLFEGNDINLVNLECALTESENEIKKIGPALKATPKTAEVLRKIGVNYCGLSNNHIFDFGVRGAKDTMDVLNRAGIKYTGFGKNYEDSRKNLVVEKHGERVCIIAVCEHEYSYALEDRAGSRPYDEYDTIADIRNARKECDRVIVLYHGGKEHCLYPSPRLRKLCRAMADNGADVVLCQHSHCIGCYELYNDCHILYGQGNFHFVKQVNENISKTWNSSLAVSYDTKTNELIFTPLITYDNSGIKFATGVQKEKIITEFEKRNIELQNGEWKKCWHKFCVSMSEQYINTVKNACNDDSEECQNEMIAHYLDCEAHTDVLRELLSTYNFTNEK